MLEIILVTTIVVVQSSANDGSGMPANIVERIKKSCTLYI